MSKRTADADNGDLPLKDRDRPEAMDIDGDNRMGEFEDEFEDEFESEDEIFEAGVDGRPDAEREAEEKGEFYTMLGEDDSLTRIQTPCRSIKELSSSDEVNSSPARPSPPI
jgi:hypothetical protein